MSPVQVTLDGQMVSRFGSKAPLGRSGKVQRVGYSTIEMAGAVLDDDALDDYFLQQVKDGRVAGARYIETEQEGTPPVVDPPADSPEAQPPQNDQALNPGRDETDGSMPAVEESAPEYLDDPEFDPDDHVQAKVLEYLRSASPEEVERVKAVEADGQGRNQIAAYQTPSSQASFEE